MRCETQRRSRDDLPIFRRAMKYLRTFIFVLILALLAAQSASAGVISNESSGVFHPAVDTILDLTGATAPQYSSIYIDAGITLSILTPTGDAFGVLLAANDIFVNGIINAGSGNLSLRAGNQIVLGLGSRILVGSLNFDAPTVTVGDTITTSGGNLNGFPGYSISPSGSLIINSGTLPINPGAGLITVRAVPEPSSILLLLPGLVFLAQRKRSCNRGGLDVCLA